MSEAYKLATISIGDYVTYRSDTNRLVRNEVVGWKTTPESGRRYVLVAGGAQQLSLDRVLARHRPGAQPLVFDELNEQKGHDHV